MTRKIVFSLLALFSVSAQGLLAQTPAFPGAEGFGAYARGGRGGDVYVVTNLSSNGPGSLRYGVENAPSSGGRTIVFAVSGYIPINYNGDTGNQTLRIVRNNITIAGQTAPGPGVALKDGRILITGNNTVIRNLRIRHGDGGGAGDCLNIDSSGDDSIIDHVSMQFSTDENISFFNSTVDDFTMQYSLSAWGLESHNAGGLWDLEDGTCHHSLWAHHKTRNPKARPYGLLEWVNNVMFDWGIGFIMGDSTTPAPWKANVIGSYFLAPPGRTDGIALESARVDRNDNPNFSLWLDNCLHDSDGDLQLDGTDKGYAIVEGSVYRPGDTEGDYRYVRAASPFPGSSGPGAVTVHDPLTAFKIVLSDAGAVRLDAGYAGPLRDEVDTLLFDNLANQRTSRISHENQLPVSNGGFGTFAPTVAPADSDRDGMPDFWEDALGGNPSSKDHNARFSNNGSTITEETFFPDDSPAVYTRLEEYLHFKSVPHATVTRSTAADPTSIAIDLRRYASGFRENQQFAIAETRGGSAGQFAGDGTTPAAGGPVVVFSPAPDFVGRAGFEFTVSDSEGSSWTRPFALLVANEELPEPETPPLAINVDFDKGSVFSGTAAAPGSGRVWNTIVANDNRSFTLPTVLTAEGLPSPCGVRVLSSGATMKSWTADSPGNPNPADLMKDYFYGNTYTVTVFDLPEGRYELYVYAHGDQADQASTVTVDAANGGGSGTVASTGSQYRNALFAGAEGHSYLRFETTVDASQRLVFSAANYLNGFQLVALPDPFVEYVEGYGLDPDGDGARGRDPDRDSVENGLEFFCGLNPIEVDAVPMAVAMVHPDGGDGRMVLRFRRLKAAADVPFAVEYSSDLAEGPWTPAVDGEGGVTVEALPLDDEFDEIVVSVPAAGPVLFGRLRL